MRQAAKLTTIFLTLLALLAWAAAFAATGDVFRVSVRSNGEQANDASYNPSVSADGRYVAFGSRATNLVDGDTNGAMDIFVHDRETGQTTRVSLDASNNQGNFDSFSPAISADGRYVAFCSYATNLAPNDTNNVPDVFLRDRQTGSTLLVSRSIFGQSGNDVSCKPNIGSMGRGIGPAISGDGRYVVFESFASDLIGNDNNGKSDIFRYDRTNGAIIRVSEDSNGFEANGNSSYPTISADGNIIAFQSAAANLVPGDGNNYTDVFARDVNAGQTRRLSVGGDGAEGNGDSFEPHVSANGQTVTFASFASNLVTGDTNSYLDVFLHNRSNGQTERVSVATDGTQINTFADIARPAVSGDGRFVTFQSRATSLVPGDLDDVTWDIFVRDRQANTLVRASVSTSGGAGNGSSVDPTISTDGFYAAFFSKANNLIPGDTNGVEDVFVYQIQETAPPPPPPPPTLSVNYASGAPGSYFHFTGSFFQQNEAVFVYANGRVIGNVQADLNGNLAFNVRSFAASQEGGYSIAAYGAAGVARAYFLLDASAPTRPPVGNGPTFPLPDGIALTEMVYLPLVAHR